MEVKNQKAAIRPVPGRSREAEEEQLKIITGIAGENLLKAEEELSGLSGQLHDLMESYGPKDKEALSMIHNTQVMYSQSQRALLRCRKARQKPYFGRIDFKDDGRDQEESYYVGRVGIAKSLSEPVVIDWRAPVASLYYDNTSGRCSYTVKNEGTYEVDLRLKRTYEIENDRLIDFFDSDVVANDALLTKYLAKNKTAVLGEIIATIQAEQNAIIRKSPKMNLIVQGVAGSGKTTVAMHRISYILYNYEEDFRPQDFYIIGSNEILLNYITSALPDLDVYGVRQMTMEQLFVRLLYEDWNPKLHKICPVNNAGDVKGSSAWFKELEDFCAAFETASIPREEVRLEKNRVILMDQPSIERHIYDQRGLSTQEKINRLNAILMSKLENEMAGKYVTYPDGERKALIRQYRQHFGKKVWRGSIFSVYEDFLAAQSDRGKDIPHHEENVFDLYDLAALAYIYKRIKETDGISEASHVIIDEAQDFGMMAYQSLYYCMRDCSYTIMGDVSQNIHFGHGLNDWEELKALMLPDGREGFCLLKKSYRNTVEISKFATDILCHGNFAVYPVEPVLRHGHSVNILQCSDEAHMVSETERTIRKWQNEGRETIAVICRDMDGARAVSDMLGQNLALADSDPKTAGFSQGVMVLSVEYTKGLEFDGVILYDPSGDHYPPADQYVKLLYVAATRALHELTVVHKGDLTDLIRVPAKGKSMALLENQAAKEPASRRERRLHKVPAELPENGHRRDGQPFQIAGEEIESKGRSRILRPDVKERPVNPSLWHFGDCPKISSLQAQKNCVLALTHAPQGAIDLPIRSLKKTKKSLYLSSGQGTLRLTPLAPNMIRVQFKKGEIGPFKGGFWERAVQVPPVWNVRAGKSVIQVETKDLIVSADKRTGALSFLDRDGKILVAENPKIPRWIGGENREQTWNYFDWEKNEKIYAKGILPDDRERMNNKARYISFGGMKMRMPLVFSDRGYGIGVAGEQTVMCCAIPMYGMYLYADGKDEVDYYFIYGKTYEGILELYKMLG